jgi:[protein-PII] uridylyltransferase
MIVQFARQMETSENLKMLLLLTIADVRAVGSEVWTNWKALLFQELYEKAFNVLERGEFHLEASSERVKAVIKKITALLEDEFTAARIREELKAMPVRLLLSNDQAAITGHVRMLIALEGADVSMQLNHQEASGYSEFTICAHDVPGLFSRITGVMAANGVNILGAQINTSRNGKVLDILQVNSPQGMLIKDEQRWLKVETEMRQAIHGEVKVTDLVARRQRPTLLTSRPAPRFATRVEIDNEVSGDYTVIDIYTHDKVGLLYLITSTLTRLGLYIGVSKISTKVDQVADVFYVRDIFGQKITKPEKLTEITEQLKTAIDEWV